MRSLRSGIKYFVMIPNLSVIDSGPGLLGNSVQRLLMRRVFLVLSGLQVRSGFRGLNKLT